MKADQVKPLFIPLKTEYFLAFQAGSKTVEYRRHGALWNAKTCRIGRPVVISHGYGNKHRMTGRVIGFEVKMMDSRDWIACYGEPGEAACIEIELDGVKRQETCFDCGETFDGSTGICEHCHHERDRIDEAEKARG
jgi:hypothetical protein